MNKVLLQIAFIISLFSLWSCAGEAKYDTAMSEFEEPTESVKKESPLVTSSFENLNKEQFNAFKIRAEQKVIDLLDYIRIISNPEVEKDFKLQSIELTKDLFVSDSSLIFKMPLTTFIDSIQKSKNQLIVIPKQIDFNSEFSNDSSEVLLANIQTNLILQGKQEVKTIDVYLIKTEKYFGDITENTLEVKLGNIY